MDVNMTKSVFFTLKTRGNFRGFFMINTISIYAVFLGLCLLNAKNNIKQQKLAFLGKFTCN